MGPLAAAGDVELIDQDYKEALTSTMSTGASLPGGTGIGSGSYSCSSSGGYYREESTQRLETYIVFDYNVLPNEPGWLPPGTVRIL